MYLAILALALGRTGLLMYAVAVSARFVAFGHWYEPDLTRRFGAEYEARRTDVSFLPVRSCLVAAPASVKAG